MPNSQRRYRLFFIRLAALLSIVRWHNIILTMLAQYAAAIFVLNGSETILDIIKNPDLHLIVFATAFIIAGGFIINSFYDVEKDMVNRPEKTLFDRLISSSFCLNIYIAFNAIALVLAILASFNIFIFFLAFVFGLWLYSHKLQKIPLLREFSAALLSVVSFFSIALYYGHLNTLMYVYGSMVFLMLINREIIKDLEGIKGDVIYGYRTIAVMIGKRNSALISQVLCVLTIIPMMYLFRNVATQVLHLYFSFGLLMMLFIVFFMRKAEKQEEYHWANRIFKGLILGAVLGIGFL